MQFSSTALLLIRAYNPFRFGVRGRDSRRQLSRPLHYPAHHRPGNTHLSVYWVKLGCGSCMARVFFLHEKSG
jgi:hypothetical protein